MPSLPACNLRVFIRYYTSIIFRESVKNCFETIRECQYAWWRPRASNPLWDPSNGFQVGSIPIHSRSIRFNDSTLPPNGRPR